jgi:DNA-binding transcriptional LysR family regulator
MIGMDTRQLRAFLTVIETGGISAAAEKLGYAQSSVSDQLRGLERDLGVPVLNRTSVGTFASEAGSRLLPYARQLLDLDGEMRRTVTGARPLLRIGALQSLADEWLPEILTAFDHGAAGPGTAADVTLTVASRDRLAAELAQGRLDAVFTLDSGPPSTGPSAVVGHSHVVLVAAPDHPLANVRPVTLDAVRQTEFLVTEIGCIYRQCFDEFGRDLGPSLRIGMITGSLNALRRLAVNGRGAALLPRFAVATELDAGDLVMLDLREGLAPLTIEARWRPGLGPAEKPLQALVELTQRFSPERQLVG